VGPPIRFVSSLANIVNRHFVIDETIRAVEAFCTFGAPAQPQAAVERPTPTFFVSRTASCITSTRLTHLLQANFHGRGAPPNRDLLSSEWRLPPRQALLPLVIGQAKHGSIGNAIGVKLPIELDRVGQGLLIIDASAPGRKD
jgi:hypothetical protein